MIKVGETDHLMDRKGVKCCGFSDNGRLAFDPLNKDHLYICYDGHKAIQLIDLKIVCFLLL